MIVVACMPSTDQLYGRVEEMDNHVDQKYLNVEKGTTMLEDFGISMQLLVKDVMV